MEWQCIRPTKWALGDVLDDVMSNIQADVERQKDGSWDWQVKNGWAGKEPTRLMAMQSAEEFLWTANICFF